jgi:hypothetical protein
MHTTKPSEEVKQQSVINSNSLRWLLGLLLLLFAEAILLYTQVAVGGYRVSSPYFWFLPIVISAPTSSAVTLCRKVASSALTESDEIRRSSLSYFASSMVLVANATIATFILVLLTHFR